MKRFPGLSGDLLEDELFLLELPNGRELPDELDAAPPEPRIVELPLPYVDELGGRVN